MLQYFENKRCFAKPSGWEDDDILDDEALDWDEADDELLDLDEDDIDEDWDV